MMVCWEAKPVSRPMTKTFCDYFEGMFRQEAGEEYEYERQRKKKNKINTKPNFLDSYFPSTSFPEILQFVCSLA